MTPTAWQVNWTAQRWVEQLARLGPAVLLGSCAAYFDGDEVLQARRHLQVHRQPQILSFAMTPTAWQVLDRTTCSPRRDCLAFFPVVSLKAECWEQRGDETVTYTESIKARLCGGPLIGCGAIDLADNNKPTSRTKQIEVRQHFLREKDTPRRVRGHTLEGRYAQEPPRRRALLAEPNLEDDLASTQTHFAPSANPNLGNVKYDLPGD
ncbi:uncharacterized protein EV422DRAFT_509365 [Fimicolochytrium jonesii]|uniref:uncharacterized protein n=1 Tax=Fimicolochytrium jonesii TaxID=1396493 RepID=UPI0022FE3F44|nr:uncharacterized protein EV422DRAFT_509365 [Fimicolochytrium jonesii]KAI8816934.1 hypothetical protein EV422DRAFT_509365 [Fimicolochytrium jonesii]